MYLAQSQTRKDNKCLRFGVILLATSLLHGCALWRGGAEPRFETANPELDVQVVPIGSIERQQNGSVPADLLRQLARVSVMLADDPVPAAQPVVWQYQWASADTLARHGLIIEARRELNVLEATVREHSARYFKLHATRYLEQARQFAFLDDEDAAGLRSLNFAIQTGEYQQAYRDGRRLVQRLWSADAWVTARAGDTLARIAGRPAVYDNYRLWPLIKAANPGYFIRSNAVAPGWRLRYPLHPRTDELFAVLESQP